MGRKKGAAGDGWKQPASSAGAAERLAAGLTPPGRPAAAAAFAAAAARRGAAAGVGGVHGEGSLGGGSGSGGGGACSSSLRSFGAALAAYLPDSAAGEQSEWDIDAMKLLRGCSKKDPTTRVKALGDLAAHLAALPGGGGGGDDATGSSSGTKAPVAGAATGTHVDGAASSSTLSSGGAISGSSAKKGTATTLRRGGIPPLAGPFVAAWEAIYPRLAAPATESVPAVRAAAHRVTAAVIMALRNGLSSKTLRSLVPVLLAGTGDEAPDVAAAASTAVTSAFGRMTAARRERLAALLLPQVVAFVRDRLGPPTGDGRFMAGDGGGGGGIGGATAAEAQTTEARRAAGLATVFVRWANAANAAAVRKAALAAPGVVGTILAAAGADDGDGVTKAVGGGGGGKVDAKACGSLPDALVRVVVELSVTLSVSSLRAPTPAGPAPPIPPGGNSSETVGVASAGSAGAAEDVATHADDGSPVAAAAVYTEECKHLARLALGALRAGCGAAAWDLVLTLLKDHPTAAFSGEEAAADGINGAADGAPDHDGDDTAAPARVRLSALVEASVGSPVTGVAGLRAMLPLLSLLPAIQEPEAAVVPEVGPRWAAAPVALHVLHHLRAVAASSRDARMPYFECLAFCMQRGVLLWTAPALEEEGEDRADMLSSEGPAATATMTGCGGNGGDTPLGGPMSRAAFLGFLVHTHLIPAAAAFVSEEPSKTSCRGVPRDTALQPLAAALSAVSGTSATEEVAGALTAAFFHRGDFDELEVHPSPGGAGLGRKPDTGEAVLTVAGVEASSAADGVAVEASGGALEQPSTPSSARYARLVALLTRIAASRSGGAFAAVFARHIVLSLTWSISSVAKSTSFDYAQVVATNNEMLLFVVAVVDAVGGDLNTLELSLNVPDDADVDALSSADYEFAAWSSTLVSLAVSVFARCVVSQNTAASVTPAAASVLSLIGSAYGQRMMEQIVARVVADTQEGLATVSALRALLDVHDSRRPATRSRRLAARQLAAGLARRSSAQSLQSAHGSSRLSAASPDSVAAVQSWVPWASPTLEAIVIDGIDEVRSFLLGAGPWASAASDQGESTSPLLEMYVSLVATALRPSNDGVRPCASLALTTVEAAVQMLVVAAASPCDSSSSLWGSCAGIAECLLRRVEPDEAKVRSRTVIIALFNPIEGVRSWGFVWRPYVARLATAASPSAELDSIFDAAAERAVALAAADDASAGECAGRSIAALALVAGGGDAGGGMVSLSAGARAYVAKVLESFTSGPAADGRGGGEGLLGTRVAVCTLISELGPATLFSDDATPVAARAAAFVAAYAVAETSILGSLDGHVANYNSKNADFPAAVARAAVAHLVSVFAQMATAGVGDDEADPATSWVWGRALPLLSAAFEGGKGVAADDQASDATVAAIGAWQDAAVAETAGGGGSGSSGSGGGGGLTAATVALSTHPHLSAVAVAVASAAAASGTVSDVAPLVRAAVAAYAAASSGPAAEAEVAGRTRLVALRVLSAAFPTGAPRDSAASPFEALPNDGGGRGGGSGDGASAPAWAQNALARAVEATRRRLDSLFRPPADGPLTAMVAAERAATLGGLFAPAARYGGRALLRDDWRIFAVVARDMFADAAGVGALPGTAAAATSGVGGGGGRWRLPFGLGGGGSAVGGSAGTAPAPSPGETDVVVAAVLLSREVLRTSGGLEAVGAPTLAVAAGLAALTVLPRVTACDPSVTVASRGDDDGVEDADAADAEKNAMPSDSGAPAAAAVAAAPGVTNALDGVPAGLGSWWWLDADPALQLDHAVAALAETAGAAAAQQAFWRRVPATAAFAISGLLYAGRPADAAAAYAVMTLAGGAALGAVAASDDAASAWAAAAAAAEELQAERDALAPLVPTALRAGLVWSEAAAGDTALEVGYFASWAAFIQLASADGTGAAVPSSGGGGASTSSSSSASSSTAAGVAAGVAAADTADRSFRRVAVSLLRGAEESSWFAVFMDRCADVLLHGTAEERRRGAAAATAAAAAPKGADLLLPCPPWAPVSPGGADATAASTTPSSVPPSRSTVAVAPATHDDWVGGTADVAAFGDVGVLAGAAFARALKHLPALSRRWYVEHVNRATSSAVEAFVRRCVSPALVAAEVDHVKSVTAHAPRRPSPPTAAGSASAAAAASVGGAGDDGVGSLSVRGSAVAREVWASYTLSEIALEIDLKLGDAFPLTPVTVEARSHAGMGAARWRKTLLAMTTLLSRQDGRVAAAVELWRSNLDATFAGVDDCPVCYSVLHLTTGALPRMTCRTCAYKFHSSCLVKWFTKSNSSACPMCRSAF